VVRVFDMECNLPISGGEAGGSSHATQGSGATFRGREQEDLAGYGMSNYGRIFTARDREEGAAPDRVSMPLDEYAAMLKEAGVEKGMIRASTNTETAEIQRTDPDLFVGFAVISPFDGMRGVRELERLVREEGLRGLSMSPLTERIPASDRRYYPMYTKAVELGIPARVYSTMNYGTDRPYDLGHPRHLDQICVDFPELTLIAGLGGWPWVPDMVALVRRHPNLYMDTSSHRPRHFGTSGSGWEMLMQFGNTLAQDKVLTGLSWGGGSAGGEAYETLVQEYLDLPLKDAVKEKWLYYNAARIFELD
jgi:predicted TIM-barrel fold metal-dependent hydrolase